MREPAPMKREGLLFMMETQLPVLLTAQGAKAVGTTGDQTAVAT